MFFNTLKVNMNRNYRSDTYDGVIDKVLEACGGEYSRAEVERGLQLYGRRVCQAKDGWLLKAG